MIDTKVIFAIVGGVWVLLFAFMFIIQKKRNSKLAAYLTANADKALLQLCGKKFWIDGRDLTLFETVSGENLDKIVALPEGLHRIAGIYQSPEVRARGKSINLESEKVEFDVELEKGHRYSIAMYADSPDERREYYKGDVPRDLLSIPLTLVKGSEDVKAYIIVYQDNVDEGEESCQRS